jgi:hypothetical protein
MVKWKVLVNRKGKHNKFWSAQVDSFGDFTGKVVYGRIGKTPREFWHPEREIAKKYFSKLYDKGYKYVSTRADPVVRV